MHVMHRVLPYTVLINVRVTNNGYVETLLPPLILKEVVNDEGVVLEVGVEVGRILPLHLVEHGLRWFVYELDAVLLIPTVMRRLGSNVYPILRNTMQHFDDHTDRSFHSIPNWLM